MPDFLPDEKKKDSKPVEDAVDDLFKLGEMRDKIKLVQQVRNDPPKTGVMKVEVPEGIHVIDLNTLLDAQLSDCPATVIPMLIDHGVRTAVDIKESYKPEKRLVNFNFWWVVAIILGLGILYVVATFFSGIFGG